MKTIIILILALVSFNAFSADSCKAFVSSHRNQMFVTGMHSGCAESCSTCHKGSFKEAPTSCKACHVAGGRASSFASPSHIPTNNLECNTCHLGNTWSPAKMSHSAVTSLTCETCHNNLFKASGARGKTAEHIPTSLTCSTCHKTTSSWDATFTHQGVAMGTCNTCHNGKIATGKPPVHIPTGASCDTCHLNYNSFTGAIMNHIGIVDSCEVCHNNTLARGKSPAHPPVLFNTCVTCHSVSGQWQCITGKLDLFFKQIFAKLNEVFA
jgi:hypothetical protein